MSISLSVTQAICYMVHVKFQRIQTRKQRMHEKALSLCDTLYDAVVMETETDEDVSMVR